MTSVAHESVAFLTTTKSSRAEEFKEYSSSTITESDGPSRRHYGIDHTPLYDSIGSVPGDASRPFNSDMNGVSMQPDADESSVQT